MDLGRGSNSRDWGRRKERSGGKVEGKIEGKREMGEEEGALPPDLYHIFICLFFFDKFLHDDNVFGNELQTLLNRYDRILCATLF